jgi:hypothetical protein
MYVYVLDHVVALRSWVDAEPLDEYQEPPSSEQFEQQQKSFEEGKYNMNLLSHLNTFSYCILILYAYKDFLATFILIYNVAEPPELHRLKYASPLSRASMYFKRCNPLVCRVPARCNHGSTGSKQAFPHTKASLQLQHNSSHLIYTHVNIITNHVQPQ